MSMHRIVLIVVVAFIIWRVLIAVGRRSGRVTAGADDFSRFSAKRRDRRQRMRQRGAEAQEELVECRACGTWVPAARATVSGDGKVYCSEACRDSRGPEVNVDGP